MLELHGMPGVGQKVIVDEHNVKIRLGIFNTMGVSREKIIPISSIISVQLKRPALKTGYLYFQTIGGMDNQIAKDANDFFQEENAITFSTDGKYRKALEIKEYVEQILRKSNASYVNISASPADEIKKYKQLMDDGIITSQEFQDKKKQLLGIEK